MAQQMSKTASAKAWMKTNTWPFIVGVVVALIVLPWQFGWYTGAGAERMATERANTATVAALTPGCIASLKANQELMAKIGRETSEYARGRLVMEAKLATGPDGAQNIAVALQCAQAILAR